MRLSTFFLALTTLVAFAANSILCRLALVSNSIGPVEFTSARLASGIIILLPLILFRKHLFGKSDLTGKQPNLLEVKLHNFRPSLALFGYALLFSLAYVQLDAGVGALILFASVQITMIGVSILQGNRITPVEWIGVLISLSGLVYLLLPGLTAPPAVGTALMIGSGVSWGLYSLFGKNQPEPILSTARNFLFCLPGVVILGLVILLNATSNGQLNIESNGLLLATLSGAVASGPGYVLWYLTVRRITTTAASVSQLVVPIIAAVGGILFLDESLTLRLVIASVLLIGGIVITILGRSKTAQ